MKLGQLLDYDNRNIFLKNYAESEAVRLVPGLLLSFKYT